MFLPTLPPSSTGFTQQPHNLSTSRSRSCSINLNTSLRINLSNCHKFSHMLPTCTWTARQCVSALLQIPDQCVLVFIHVSMTEYSLFTIPGFDANDYANAILAGDSYPQAHQTQHAKPRTGTALELAKERHQASTYSSSLRCVATYFMFRCALATAGDSDVRTLSYGDPNSYDFSTNFLPKSQYIPTQSTRNPSNHSKRSSPSLLAQQLRLRLAADNESDIPRNPQNMDYGTDVDWRTVWNKPQYKQAVDNSIRKWQWIDGNELVVIRGHTKPVTSLCLSPDESHLVSASDDYSVRIWDLETNQQVGDPLWHDDGVEVVAMSSNGYFASATPGPDAKIYVWSLDAALEHARSLGGHAVPARDISIAPRQQSNNRGLARFGNDFWGDDTNRTPRRSEDTSSSPRLRNFPGSLRSSTRSANTPSIQLQPRCLNFSSFPVTISRRPVTVAPCREEDAGQAGQAGHTS
ncbi:hypothetical protein BDR06DRAFT_1012430 [Suillus hirtellus]|nr:hypothetical protein BDR06DRAFT_1012430 [Suillus hirtellus]